MLNDCTLVLSDFSDGMVEIVSGKFAECKSFSFQQIDIQNIPFLDNAFDVVIANHMLCHVPDLTKALSEVKRVLKTDGIFYSSTIGSGGLQTFLYNVFRSFDSNTKAFAQQYSFVLQNGFDILREHFSDVKRIDYKDSLSITETQDLMDWIKSTITISCYPEQDFDGLFNYFEDIIKRDGAINIPKEAGLFISKK